MDIRQLKYFVAVAEKLSFTEAAKTLYVAQSAVSQQISELERQLGIPLFKRNRRSVALTPAGNVLYCEATGLLKRFDEVAENTKNAHLGFKGHLRIGYIGYGDRRWLPGVLRNFQARYPDVTLEVNRFHQGALIKALRENELDLGITFSFGISDAFGHTDATASHSSSELLKEGGRQPWQLRHILTETLCAVLPKDSPLAIEYKDQRMPLQALATAPFILQNRHESPQGYDKTLQICSAHGFSPRIVNTPTLVQTVMLLVEAQIGVAILPGSLATYAGPNLAFIPLDLPKELAQYDIVAAWKTDNVNPVLEHLLEVMSDVK